MNGEKRQLAKDKARKALARPEMPAMPEKLAMLEKLAILEALTILEKLAIQKSLELLLAMLVFFVALAGKGFALGKKIVGDIRESPTQ